MIALINFEVDLPIHLGFHAVTKNSIIHIEQGIVVNNLVGELYTSHAKTNNCLQSSR